MQNKATRLVTHAPQRSSRREMFNKLNWLTVHQLLFYHSALSTFRIRGSNEPEYLSTILTRDNRAERIIISNTNLTLTKNSYCYRDSGRWNSLPDYIRKTKKIGLFKSQLKKWTTIDVSQFVEDTQQYSPTIGTGPRQSQSDPTLSSSSSFIVV